LERDMSDTETLSGYTLAATTALPFGEAVERVRAELADEGFGVLCEIDVQATMKAKLGAEIEPYVILGACSPPLAHEALETEPELGVLLPCNVVVFRAHGQTHVSAIDAERMLSIVDNEALASIAAKVREKLARAVERSASE
jgi:uncharacterized protein (DUF302 family)